MLHFASWSSCFGSLKRSSVASMAGPTIPKLSCACQSGQEQAETEPMVGSTATFQDWRAQWHEKLQVQGSENQQETRSIRPAPSNIVIVISSPNRLFQYISVFHHKYAYLHRIYIYIIIYIYNYIYILYQYKRETGQGLGKRLMHKWLVFACWGTQYGWERAIRMIRFGPRKFPPHQVKVSHEIPQLCLPEDL